MVGYQAAGEVIEVGSEVTNLKVGDKVCTTSGWGSHAELRAVSARTAWKIPDSLSTREAAVIPVTFGTADDCLFEFGRLKAGEIALIQAGASGVGVAAIQLAAKAGATMVIATASSDERLEKLKALGMTHGINYATHDVVEEVMRITEKQGADVVVDSVGGAMLQGSILSLAYRGRVSTVGQAGRDRQKMDLSTLMGGNRTISGVFLGAEINTDRVQKNMASLIDRVARGDLKVVIDRDLPPVGGGGRAPLYREPAGCGAGAADPVSVGQAKIFSQKSDEAKQDERPHRQGKQQWNDYAHALGRSLPQGDSKDHDWHPRRGKTSQFTRRDGCRWPHSTHRIPAREDNPCLEPAMAPSNWSTRPSATTSPTRSCW